MKPQNARIFIYPKDVSMITGKSMKASYKLFNRIRRFFNKEPHHVITVTEFCQYMGVNPLDIMSVLV